MGEITDKQKNSSAGVVLIYKRLFVLTSTFSHVGKNDAKGSSVKQPWLDAMFKVFEDYCCI